MSANLMLHAGSQLVSMDELRACHTPQPVGRWHPVSHVRVLESVKESLGEGGYSVASEKLAITKEGARFFGTLDLTAPLVPGVTLAVGVRNSVDKTFPLGFCAGSRVFVCDNLAFSAELMVRRKHTLNGAVNFRTGIAQAVFSLGTFVQAEEKRIKLMQNMELRSEQADSLILQSYERDIIGARDLPKVIKEWREPSFVDFQPRTVWSLFNAYTTALRERTIEQPNQFALQTMRLTALLGVNQEIAQAV